MGYDDDDSINTIGKKLTEQVNNVTRAHNANSIVTSTANKPVFMEKIL